MASVGVAYPLLRGSVPSVWARMLFEAASDSGSEWVLFRGELVDEVACVAPEGEIVVVVVVEVVGVGVSAQALPIVVVLLVVAIGVAAVVVVVVMGSARRRGQGVQGDVGGLACAAPAG